MTPPTALIADDEPLLREVLRALLATQWPELQIVAQARNGLEAAEQFEAFRPTVCFLDIHMPGMSGIEVAQRVAGRAHVVFITAFDQYALKAFEHGVFDYLVKPVQADRLAATLARLRERLRLEQPAVATDALLQQLADKLKAPAGAAPSGHLRWIRAAVGSSVRLIPVEDIEYLKSDEKYTLVAWRGDGGQLGEALIRTSLKTLVDQLDPARFQQVHRSVVVNLAAVSHVTPGDNEKADLHFKHRPEVLPVSRTYLHLFKAE
ncbi:LytR/AlgR family response regulator transcription factor [Ideonella sp.]|uniref:LytR/AlgR family response regulator transcription factor n=1 Tax=Ideonella sp. TaxID=1929293 RepID=UPI0035B3A0F4